MPAINLPTINIDKEDFKSKETMENILDTLIKYRKELNYLLMNLDIDNMPLVGGLMEDLEGNYSSLVQTVDGIYIQVGNIEGDIADFRVEADNITAIVTNNQGDIGALQIQANQIIVSVSDANGAIAALTLTAEGIQTQVTDNLGHISTLTQTAGEIQTLVADLNTYTDEQIVLLDGKIATVNTTISDQYSAINQKADNIALSVGNLATTVTNQYDSVTGDISSLSTTVTQNKAAIDLKADGITSTVSTLSTRVTNNYNALTGDISSIDTEISNQWSEISQLAGSITSKVSTSDFTGATLVSMIEQTATNITLSAGKIDLNGITRVNSDLTLGSAGSASTYLRFGNGPLITGYYGGSESNLTISASKVFMMGTIDFSDAVVTGLTTSTTMKFA